MKNVYLDYAATTYVRPEVAETMAPYMYQDFANPSGIYRSARRAKIAVENAREEIAELLGADHREIYFTSGGTESNNWAIFGVMRNCCRCTFLTSVAEHKSILNSANYLKSTGVRIQYISVDEYGKTDISEIKNSITKDTALISVMWANNETGIINPINRIKEIAHECDILFHTDAVAAAPHLRLNTNNIDLMSISAHKLYGPKGVGLLYIKKGVNISPYIFGGNQEGGMRAGTENVAGVIGFAKALKLAIGEIEENEKKFSRLNQYMTALLMREIPGVLFNGSSKDKLPNIVNISMPNVDSQTALIALDLAGVACSAGSACLGGGFNKSHVLTAMNLNDNRVNNALRFSFGEKTDIEQINYIVNVLKKLYNRTVDTY